MLEMELLLVDMFALGETIEHMNSVLSVYLDPLSICEAWEELIVSLYWKLIQMRNDDDEDDDESPDHQAIGQDWAVINGISRGPLDKILDEQILEEVEWWENEQKSQVHR